MVILPRTLCWAHTVSGGCIFVLLWLLQLISVAVIWHLKLINIFTIFFSFDQLSLLLRVCVLHCRAVRILLFLLLHQILLELTVILITNNFWLGSWALFYLLIWSHRCWHLLTLNSIFMFINSLLLSICQKFIGLSYRAAERVLISLQLSILSNLILLNLPPRCALNW